MADDRVEIVTDVIVNTEEVNSATSDITKSFGSMKAELQSISETFEKTRDKYRGHIKEFRSAINELSIDLDTTSYSVMDFFNQFANNSFTYYKNIKLVRAYKDELNELKTQQSQYTDLLKYGATQGSEAAIKRETATYQRLSDTVSAYELRLSELNTREKDISRQLIVQIRELDRYKDDLTKLKDMFKAGKISEKQYTAELEKINSHINFYIESLKELRDERAKIKQERFPLSQSKNNKIERTTKERDLSQQRLTNLTRLRPLSDEEYQKTASALAVVNQRIQEITTELANIPTNKLDYIGARLQEIAYMYKKGDTEDASRLFEQFTQELDNAQLSSKELRSRLDELKRSMGLIKEEHPMENISQSAKKAGSAVNKLNTHTKKTHHSFKLLHKLASSLKSSLSSTFNKFFNTKKLMRVFLQFGLSVRSAYLLVRKMRTEFIDAMKSMAGSFPELNAQVSKLTMSFNQLKGSLVTMIQPIASYVIPILTRLFNILSALANTIGQFFAVLTGQNKIYKATAANVDYADSVSDVGSAAKEANKELAEYDNLLVIPQDSASSDSGSDGVGSGDLGYSFDEEPAISEFAKKLKDAWAKVDFEGVGLIIADKLNELTAVFDDWILNTLNTKAKYWTKAVALVLNGVFEGWDAKRAGKTLKNLINTVLETINVAITTFNWKHVGQRLGEFFTGIFSDGSIGTNAGKTLGNTIHGILEFAIEFLRSDPGGSIGKNVANFINELFDANKNGELGIASVEIINNINSFLTETFNNIDWTELGKSLSSNIGSILDNFDMEEFKTALRYILSAITDIIVEIFDWLLLPDDLGQTGISKMINFVFDSIVASIEAVPISKVLSALVSVAARIVASLPSIVAWVGGAITQLFGEFLNIFFPTLGDSFISAGEDWVEIGNQMSSQIVDPMISALDSVISKTTETETTTSNATSKIISDYENTKNSMVSASNSITSDYSSIAQSANNAALSVSNSNNVSSISVHKYTMENKLAESTIVGSNQNIQISSNETSSVINENYKSLQTTVAKYAQEERRNKEDIDKVNRDSSSSLNTLKLNTESSYSSMNSSLVAHRAKMVKVAADTKAKYSEMSESASNTAASISTAFTSRNWYSIGNNIMTGIGNGINGAWNWLKNKVSNVASSLLSSAKNVLNIHSPSKVFQDEVGLMAGYGLGIGFENSQPFILNKMDSVADNMIKEFSNLDVTPDEMLSFSTIDKSFDILIDNVIGKFETMLNKLEDIASKFTFKLPTLSVSMPNIARGSVMPTNAEFARAVSSSSSSDTSQSGISTSSFSMPERIQIVLPNGKVLAETVWDEERKLYKQTGHSSPRFA